MHFLEKDYYMIDMDGTLLDSMEAWCSTGPEYAKQILGECNGEITDDFAHLSIRDGLVKLSEIAGVDKVSFNGFLDILLHHYLTDVTIKDGVVEFLKVQKASGKHMCIITATPEYAAIPCLKHHGLYDFFDFILTTDKYPHGKGSPEVFYDACNQFNCDISDAVMFEDALYSIKTSTSIGLYTVAVSEKVYNSHKDEIIKTADNYYENGFADILNEVNNV